MAQQADADGTGETRRKRFDLSLPQVAGSAFAAVAAAVLASKLGMYGTIVGAGVMSVIATCGGTIFSHLFRRTGEQIRVVTVQVRPKALKVPATRPEFARPGAADEVRWPSGEFGEATTHGTRVRGWKRSSLAAVVVFLVAMSGVTGYELLSGHELNGGSGTTVSSVVHGGSKGSAPSSGPSDTTDQRQHRHPNRDGGQERSPDPSPGSGTDGTGQSTPGSGSGTGPSANPSPTPDATTPDQGAATPTPSDPSDGGTSGNGTDGNTPVTPAG
ncbi:hypothetical protein AB0436_19265 [Streptomyces sp. NPDC051322]|uniref:hypothetical protein n=1 Tax=Streptomyces sp. NPDC051322 TaxID=3154645 RepID=UPI0034504974